jgi:Arylsulfotransferase (ASST)
LRRRSASTGARVAALATLIAVAATPAASAQATPVVTADPALKPAFHSGFLDYTVRCTAGTPVRLTIDPPPHTRVTAADGHPHGRRFHASVELAPGRAAALRFVAPGRSRTYRIRCLPEDFPDWHVRRAGTTQASWYLVTPNIRPGGGYGIVFDRHGVPVWWDRRRPAPFNMDLRPNGHFTWTSYVALSPNADEFGEWTLDGRRVRSYHAVGRPTNQHDLQPLPNGNTLLIAYPRRDGVDLSRFGGPEDAIVVDGEIQEVDPQGRLVWSWNTRDHIALQEGERWLRRQIAKPVVHTYDGRPVYDLVHMNSVEAAGRRVVFSSRYLEALYAVDRATHAVAWKLGGTRTSRSLTIEDDPYANEDFGGQHDARILGRNRVTFFDNGTLRDRWPRAVEFTLDLERRAARLRQDVRFRPAGRSTCCGGARLLPGGNWVVSWGDTPWVTELSPEGRRVLSIRFLGRYASYRAIPVLPGRLSRSDLSRGMDAITRTASSSRTPR